MAPHAAGPDQQIVADLVPRFRWISDSSTETIGLPVRMRIPFSSNTWRATCTSPGSKPAMIRVSRSWPWYSSASSPATSTPVSPPPTTTTCGDRRPLFTKDCTFSRSFPAAFGLPRVRAFSATPGSPKYSGSLPRANTSRL